jgi:hypothetical protein
MIETMRDLKHHSKSGSHEKLTLERTASQILHHMEDKDSEDSLESTRARVLCEFPCPRFAKTPNHTIYSVGAALTLEPNQ